MYVPAEVQGRGSLGLNDGPGSRASPSLGRGREPVSVKGWSFSKRSSKVVKRDVKGSLQESLKGYKGQSGDYAVPRTRQRCLSKAYSMRPGQQFSLQLMYPARLARGASEIERQAFRNGLRGKISSLRRRIQQLRIRIWLLERLDVSKQERARRGPKVKAPPEVLAEFFPVYDTPPAQLSSHERRERDKDYAEAAAALGEMDEMGQDPITPEEVERYSRITAAGNPQLPARPG